MNSFAVIERAKNDEIIEKYPSFSRIGFVNKLIQPYKSEEMLFNNILGVNIKIPEGFEKLKIKRAYNTAVRKYNRVFSREYDIDFNKFFYHSCLIRALDFYTISLGCDIRLNEVVIADAATPEGKDAFFLLLPIARRIVLLTEKKKELLFNVEYAISKYGTSAAIIEDPVKAAERADIIILSSKNDNYRYIAELKRPMLILEYIVPPKHSYWFNDVDIAFDDKKMDIIFAQGYVELKQKKIIWSSAEDDGFKIKNIKRYDDILIER
ncbi:hypothetical protein SAMN05443428_1459 [Caloramator quimbayensis]|uniref:Uncharacterized protein n=1 Tax=Caloramator quimbayensis TaxID=1147123 RepID=A0A1T4YFP5_9CLOT|nr:hypothetical protein [Caloramator quimbayensis]SKB00599.1 hypothetical protein SAMN05443428_1459 [Caloramator quimbayensis]